MPFVATAGSNGYGQLGRGGDPAAFAVVSLDDDVCHVACGDHHTVAVCASGAVLGWGRNSDGQLGLGPGAPRAVAAPRRIDGGALAGARVVRAAAAASHTLFLTRVGEVVVVGSGAYGQLGDGTCVTAVHTPQLVRGLPDPAVDVACGARTCFALTADGVVYGWGESLLGALGSPGLPVPVVRVPTRLVIGPQRTRIARVAAGDDFTVFLTTTGEALAAGRNDKGQLGIDAAAAPVWQYVRRAGRLRDVACGGSHTVTLDAGGSAALLGATPTPPHFAGVDCVGVAAGGGCSLLRAADGTLQLHGRRAAASAAAAAAPDAVAFPPPLRVAACAAGVGHQALLLSERPAPELSSFFAMEDAALTGAPRAAERWSEDISNVSFSRGADVGLQSARTAAACRGGDGDDDDDDELDASAARHQCVRCGDSGGRGRSGGGGGGGGTTTVIAADDSLPPAAGVLSRSGEGGGGAGAGAGAAGRTPRPAPGAHDALNNTKLALLMVAMAAVMASAGSYVARRRHQDRAPS